MTTVLEINAESVLITVSKGFLLLRRDDNADKIPLADIESVIINSHGAMLSNHALMRLAELGIPILHCNTNAMPVSLTLPYGNNVYRKDRIDLQIKASLPLYKNLWQQVIKAKIQNQALVLKLCGKSAIDLETMISKVGSGDPGNVEAIAARAYWERLFGKGFRRNPDLEGINSYLNYGYAILRASFCRNLVATGLIPELGIHHCNRKDPYCLADDLMEPYRPYIDFLVFSLKLSQDSPLTVKAKQSLVGILHLEIDFMEKQTHLRFAIAQCVQLFIDSLQSKKALMQFPKIDEEAWNLIKGPIVE